MRPRAAATSRIIGDASRGISRPVPLVLRIICVLALLVHAAVDVEAVVSAKRPWYRAPPRIRGRNPWLLFRRNAFVFAGVDRSYDQAMV